MKEIPKKQSNPCGCESVRSVDPSTECGSGFRPLSLLLRVIEKADRKRVKVLIKRRGNTITIIEQTEALSPSSSADNPL